MLPCINRAHACWLDDQEKQDCSYACKLVTRVHAIVQVCLTGCRCTCKVAHMHARTARLHIRMQESTCACKAASTHARLHVCTQELHDCTHTRKLDPYTPRSIIVSSRHSFRAFIHEKSFQIAKEHVSKFLQRICIHSLSMT